VTNTVTRDDLITHILTIMQFDKEYARWALRKYHEMMLWVNLMDGVRDALKAKK